MAKPRKTRLKIGVIGLGIIGTRVAANLRAAGHQVYVWSRSPRSVPNFLGSVVEVADLCDIIQIFVSDDDALRDVARTITAALTIRHVVAVHATVSPEAARETATIIESQGARYLDAPFTGSKAAAQDAQLVYYVGGDAQALAEARPALEASSKQILYVGGIGDASVLKIATNMLTASTVQTLAEALALVRSAGIDGAKLAEALEHNASRSATADFKLAAMLARNFEANFSLKHMLKDARLALDAAEKASLYLPVAQTVGDVLSSSVDEGWGEEDFAVVARNYDLPSVVEEEKVEPGKPPTEPEGGAESPESAPVPLVEAHTPEPAPVLSQQMELLREPGFLPPPPDPIQTKKSTLRIIREFFNPNGAVQK